MLLVVSLWHSNANARLVVAALGARDWMFLIILRVLIEIDGGMLPWGAASA